MAKLEWRDLWALYCPELKRDELDDSTWLQRIPAEWPSDDGLPVDVCDWLAQLYLQYADAQHRKELGQFFTPPAIARFMAKLSDRYDVEMTVIEPGAGLGVLIAAMAECVSAATKCQKWNVIAYEVDADLRPALALVLGYTRQWLSQWGIEFSFEIRPEDFILANATVLRPAPLFDQLAGQIRPDLIIANPPYFKLPKADPRVGIMAEFVHGQPNIYTLFMAAAAKLLRPNGQLIFITPRSFCSGAYFQQFRQRFFQIVRLERVHVFESRTEAFERDEVLQENIIFRGRRASMWLDSIELSSSYGAYDLSKSEVRTIPLGDVLDLDSPSAVLSLPTDPTDTAARNLFGHWPDRLRTLGLEISTGPVVPFRTTTLVNDSDGAPTAPLLWVQHVQRMSVTWPIMHLDKPQWIRVQPESHRLLLPNKTYVLIRRFSPKEENSRITAAPYFKGDLPSEFVGIENHVNYLHRLAGSLTEVEALGLAAFLNSQWVDLYFRQSSGNTQVSATELRDLPLPPMESIRHIGARLHEAGEMNRVAILNQVVGEELNLPLDMRNGNGGHMPKIEEAKELLKLVGLPPTQRNELAALTLLALANLKESDPWQAAQRRSIRIHDMLSFVEQNYHKRYAENTRETFRRQVLHQFEQARIVDRNPDEPTLATNSPRTHYAISQAFLPVIKNYGTRTGERHLSKFVSEQGMLVEVYQKRHAQNLIALRDSTGHEYRLSPGEHNQLQAAVIEQFAPRFAPRAKLLYLGDTANKTLVMDADELARLGFPADKHSKLPDIVLYLPKKKWLFLIEAVTSHRPVSPKRHQELEKLLHECSAGRVYVSAFPDFKEYLRHCRNIAWETEVWIAEAPDHLIHYNGYKFSGPYKSKGE